MTGQNPAAPAAVLLAALLLKGCATIDSQMRYWDPTTREDPPALSDRMFIYGGTASNVRWPFRMLGARDFINPEMYILIPLLFDLPLSLAADTAILPLSIGQQIESAVSGPPAIPPEEPGD